MDALCPHFTGTPYFFLIVISPFPNTFLLFFPEGNVAVKCFSTLITLIGILPSLNYLMSGEVWLLGKGFYHTDYIHRASPLCELSHAR
jgi:hypothetical protein